MRLQFSTDAVDVFFALAYWARSILSKCDGTQSHTVHRDRGTNCSLSGQFPPTSATTASSNRIRELAALIIVDPEIETVS